MASIQVLPPTFGGTFSTNISSRMESDRINLFFLSYKIVQVKVSPVSSKHKTHLIVYCLVSWDYLGSFSTTTVFDFLCYNRMRFYAYYVSVSRPKHHVLARLSEAKLAEDKHAPPLLYSSSYKVFGQPSSLIVTLAINFKLTSLLRALAQIRYRLLAQASSPIHAHNT